MVIPLVFFFAGNGTWLSYLFAMVATLLVGLNLNQYAKRSSSPGSLYTYVTKGLGVSAGVISGWALILAYTITSSAVLAGFVNYLSVLLAYGGITISPLILGLIGALTVWYISIKDVQLSGKIMLVLEAVSILLIFALAIIVLIKSGFKIDFTQFKLKGVTPTGISLGLVLAFFSFVGCESATSLGDESKNPLKNIPKAVIASIIICGTFFILMAYTEIMGFEGQAIRLSNSSAPLADLANFNGISFFGPLISVGALISFWGCCLGCINAGARILLTMGQHGLIHQSIGKVHKINKTPYVALNILTIFSTSLTLILIVCTGGLSNISNFYKSNVLITSIYAWTGTLATYGFICAYALIAISAPIYLKRQKELKTKHIVLSVITVLILMIPIVGSVYTNATSPAPYPSLVFIFLGWLVVGGLWIAFKNHQKTDDILSTSKQIKKVSL